MNSKIFFLLLLLISLAFALSKDYVRDKGEHRKAKIYNAVILILMYLMYASTLGIVSYLIRNFAGAYEAFSVPVGFVPGSVHFAFYLLHTFLSLAILISCYQMSQRKEKARRIFISLLPFLAIMETFSFYRGWLSGSDDAGLSHPLILLLGLTFMGGMMSIIVWIYNSKWMKDFYNSKPEIINNSETAANTENAE